MLRRLRPQELLRGHTELRRLGFGAVWLFGFGIARVEGLGGIRV